VIIAETDEKLQNRDRIHGQAAVATFENGRERGWTGSDLTSGAHLETCASPPVS